MEEYMDRKLESFLTVCRTMNYRAAAEKLHLTQPAITKQIQALETEYEAKLFIYDGRRLQKTEKGRLLEAYAQSLEYNYEEMKAAMKEEERLHLRVGATKTIGDFVIDKAIMRYLHKPEHELTLIVDNTVQLLKGLNENTLDFAIIEGRFDKNRYQFRLFRNEPFIGIRARTAESPENGKREFHIEYLLKETIIVREKGSGTRELFERDLESMGYSLSSFARIIELSSFRLIKKAVREGLGISFMYRSVIGDDDAFEAFSVPGIQSQHEFNVVSLKNTPAQAYAEKFLQEAEMI